MPDFHSRLCKEEDDDGRYRTAIKEDAHGREPASIVHREQGLMIWSFELTAKSARFSRPIGPIHHANRTHTNAALLR